MAATSLDGKGFCGSSETFPAASSQRLVLSFCFSAASVPPDQPLFSFPCKQFPQSEISTLVKLDRLPSQEAHYLKPCNV